MSAFAPEDPDSHDYSYTEADPATSTPPIPQEQTMDTDTEASHGRGHSNNPLLGDNTLVSDLEQEVLDEYARLLRNVNQVRGEDLCSPLHRSRGFARVSKDAYLMGNDPADSIYLKLLRFLILIDLCAQLSDKLSDLAGSPASMPLDGLRLLERKTATVCTLLKASVYSIVLQQQIWNENEEQQQQQQQNEDQHFQDQDYQYGGYDGEGEMTFH
jgi:DASH complex subunit DAD3